MKNVLIIGMGKSGKSCAKLLKSKEIQVTGVDQKPEPFLDISILSDNDPIDVKAFDLAVLSPGIPSTHPLVIALEKASIEIISEIELGLRFLKPERQIVGITGTNGKTTVTSMIAHSLNFLGIKAHAVGNVGRPLTDALEEEGVLVIELSSFQLERTFKAALDVAVLLRITPDHLDRYPSVVEYANAKIRIASLLKPHGLLVLHKDTSRQYPDLAKEHETHFIGFREYTENEQATIGALSYFGKTILETLKALSTFRAPPHRMEWVAEINGVNYYNDSKATNVDSVLYALKAMKGPIHLIAGGTHKGHPYSALRPFIEEKVEKIYTIGEAASLIEEDLKGTTAIYSCGTLENAIKKASKEAKPGTSILLSPACSSFDQFKNYEDRGAQFREAVNALKSVE